jgi:hypothetical protein
MQGAQQAQRKALQKMRLHLLAPEEKGHPREEVNGQFLLLFCFLFNQLKPCAKKWI